VIPWDGFCQRCFKRSSGSIMSMMNEALICSQCKGEERQHPDYKKAEARDLEAYAGRMESAGCSPGQVETVRGIARKMMEEELEE
jgi:hypothetical protein